MTLDNMDLTDSNVEDYLEHAKTAIAGMSLTSVQLEDFLVVMNSKPDVMISEEPYFSHMILVEVKSGVYIRRIWNRTVERGMACNLDQLADLCNKHFFQGRPCVGCPLLNSEEEEEFAISQTPIPRRISKYCHEVLSYDAGDEETTCQECLKLGVGSEYQTPLDEGTNCEVVIKSEPDDWEVEDTQHGIHDEGMIEPDTQVHKPSPSECPISVGRGPQKLGKIRRSRSGKITYGELITEAITNSDMKMLPLSRIYEYITNKYPFFKMENRGWQNSIRHNLSLHNSKFMKIPSPGSGKGNLWAMVGGAQKIKDADVVKDISKSKLDEGDHVKDADIGVMKSLKEESEWEIEEVQYENESKTDPDTKMDDDHGKYEGVIQEPQFPLKCEQNVKSEQLVQEPNQYNNITPSLLNHMSLTKQYACKVCGMLFESVVKVFNHAKEVHSIDIKVRKELKYHELITNAINDSAKKFLSLSEIYLSINKEHPYFKMDDKGWQNAIRHNLTLNKKFEKVPRLRGRGNWWVIKGGDHDIELMMSLNHETLPIEKEEASEISDTDVKNVKEDSNFIVTGNKLLASCMQDPNDVEGIKNGNGVPVKFKCRFCEKGYPIRESLISHAKRMHGLGDFKCGECTFQALYVSEMVNHSKQEHQIESQEIECPICKCSVEVSAITEHYQECLLGKGREVPVECKWCGKVSKSKAALWLHEMRNHGRGKFVCPYCQAKASFSHDLIKHMRLEDHGTNRDIICPSCKSSISQNEIVAHYELCFKSEKNRKSLMEKIKCKTCGKICNGKKSYNSHIKVHMRAEGVNESETNMKLYHYCDKCDMRFLTNTRLTDHIRTVHDKMDLTCPECPMTFKTSSQLYRHKNVAHSKDERFECKYCGMRFAGTTRVRDHERVHEDAKFQCRFCSKMLKSEKSLQAHERHHTGEANYLCKVCNKAFTTKNGLRSHEQGVHKIIGPQGGTGWLRKKKTDET